MVYRILIFIMLFVFTVSSKSQAQTVSEWIRQKKTQKKYLLQQIVALQVYIKYLKKGNKIARKGLATISDIKNDEFRLHQVHFNSLKTVNPVILNYSRVAEINSLYNEIISTYQIGYRQAQESSCFDSEEIKYINRVYQRLIDECNATINQLNTVLQDQKFEMTDDERISHIDNLYLEVQDQYNFIKSFSSELMILAAQREQEKNDVKTSRTFNGINNK